MKGKLVIFSAPSGSGKTTIVKALLKKIPELEFSISATSRPPRDNETHERDYYFLSPEEFKTKIDQNEFVEWEEVYTNRFYGTLEKELQRIWEAENHVIFDVDVIGGLNLKKKYGKHALSVFIEAPDFNSLKERLLKRSSEDEKSLAARLEKAKEESSYKDQFDVCIVNDNLEDAIAEAELTVSNFLKQDIV